MTIVEVKHRLAGRQDGPVVLLSNSLGSTIEMWEPQLPALAERFRVLRYDHRGHGASPVPPGPYELDDLGRDVLALLDGLGFGRVHVCGLSLGGMVGQWLAVHAPERVDRLALLSTSARLGPASAWAERAATVLERGTSAVADIVLERWLTPRFAARQPELVRDLRAMICATPAEGYAACCGVIERMDLEPELGHIRAPTLVIAGADDQATPPEHAYRIATAVPSARVVILDDAAHLANVEQPAEVTRLLIEHLTRTESHRK
jgi:3-oxoadipate enol-lactonase